ncbi:alpha-hydroxyketone-type quorum-sensing autoinducer synthase [Nocardia sp. XZ_19_385]|uniref:alpha-hydroxyketone-type quorum-sensing autoinducer synthase n=1 Tax=Nocardia sp. XZ_19_385 TaxID=2769488 RepID=UPI00188F840A|nr:alpha-hydroxyketone-type quorum-sensing autoinducer synthase [Nocardia sp. XZ_19_385]
MIPTIADRVQSRVDRFSYGRVVGEWGGRHLLHGLTPGPDAVLLNSNDYLGLAGDQRIVEAMCAALAAGGARFTSGAFVDGDHPQIAVERELADHMRAPAGILCQSGWDANIGLLQSIADPRTPVYLDSLAHMSMWHGAKVAGAPIHPFRHNFPGHLREEIRTYGPGIIAVDSIYSTNGSRAPLAQLCDVAEQTGSLLVVDETRSLGTDGPLGAGSVVALGLAERVPFRVASLSGALAGRAGFVAANGVDFVDYFRMESFPAVFSGTLLPHDLAGISAALAAARADDWRRERLVVLSERVRTALTSLGFDLESAAGHIIALQAGPDLRALAMRDFLEARGIFGAVLCPPATARHRTIVRFCLHADLTDTEVDRIIQACKEVRDAFGTIPPTVPIRTGVPVPNQSTV